MRSQTLLLTLLIFAVIAAGCQQDSDKGASITDSFIGGTSAMKIAFIENSPPAQVTDKPTGGTGFPFDASVTIENIGEGDIGAGEITVAMSGFYPGDFEETQGALNGELTQTYPASGVFRGVSKDPDGNRIQGDIAQITFPKTPAKKLMYNKALTGNQQFPFRAEICYPYFTKVLSQVCLMKDFTSTEKTVCNPTGLRPVSNSGAPVHVTSVTQSVGGKNKLLLNFEITKVGSSDLFKLDEGIAGCIDSFANKDRIFVQVGTGIPGLNCLGLLGGEGAGGSYSGYVLLSGGKASFTCIQEYTGTGITDSLKTFDVTLAYYARDSITTNVLVKHLI